MLSPCFPRFLAFEEHDTFETRVYLNEEINKIFKSDYRSFNGCIFHT